MSHNDSAIPNPASSQLGQDKRLIMTDGSDGLGVLNEGQLASVELSEPELTTKFTLMHTQAQVSPSVAYSCVCLLLVCRCLSIRDPKHKRWRLQADAVQAWTYCVWVDLLT